MAITPDGTTPVQRTAGHWGRLDPGQRHRRQVVEYSGWANTLARSMRWIAGWW